MKTFLPLMAMLAFSCDVAAERISIPAQLWLDARSGESIAANPVIAGAVRRMIDRPQATLAIYHTRDDESLVRAEELRGWLISLGVDASRLSLSETRAIANAADRILTIEVIDNK